jgi:hypothetical protein
MTLWTDKTGRGKSAGVHIYVMSVKKTLKKTMSELGVMAQDMYNKHGLWPTFIRSGGEVHEYISTLPEMYNGLHEGDWAAPARQIHLGILQEDMLSGRRDDDILPEWLAPASDAPAKKAPAKSALSSEMDEIDYVDDDGERLQNALDELMAFIEEN